MSKKKIHIVLSAVLCYALFCMFGLQYFFSSSFFLLHWVCARPPGKTGAPRSISLALSCTACTIYAQFSFVRTKRNILKL